MKYNVGDEFILKTSLGDKKTKIVNVKYEFADYIKGGPKYVSEQELEGYILSGVLTEVSDVEIPSEEEIIKVIRFLSKNKSYTIDLKDLVKE